MFKWLKRLLGNDPVVSTVNIHITGEIKLNYEGRPGHPMAALQEPVNPHAPSKIGDGVDRSTQAAEPSIGPELFADTGTPAVDFGINVEEPPTGTPD